jgi:hypothetical protein
MSVNIPTIKLVVSISLTSFSSNSPSNRLLLPLPTQKDENKTIQTINKTNRFLCIIANELYDSLSMKSLSFPLVLYVKMSTARSEKYRIRSVISSIIYFLLFIYYYYYYYYILIIIIYYYCVLL